MSPRKKAQEAEPIALPVTLSVEDWAQETITRLYLAKHGVADTERIEALTNLYIRILVHEGIHEVTPNVIEDTPIAEKPKRKGGRPKKVIG